VANISIEKNLPGLTGSLQFRKDTSDPLRELTQILLHGDSLLSDEESEFIAIAFSPRMNVCIALHHI